MGGDEMKLYHIDRLGELNEGMILDFLAVNKIPNIIYKGTEISSEINSVIKRYFDNRLSSHGINYVNLLFEDNSSEKIEIVFELIRQLKFNERPSRYQSFFAVEKCDIRRTIDLIHASETKYRVFEIESDNYFKADMNLLAGSGGIILVNNAEKYWSQKESADPLNEYLVQLPIKVGRLLQSDEY